MALDLRTVGEQLVGHPLVSERRGGVPHYVPGQHHAVVERIAHEGEDLGIGGTVSYVDRMGHAVSVICLYEEGWWGPHLVGRAGHSTPPAWKPVHEIEGFKLSGKCVQTLEAARQAAGLEA